MATMAAASIYGPQSGGATGQQRVNPPGNVSGAPKPTGWAGTGGLQPIASGLGVSVPFIFVVLALAWWLLRTF